MNALQEGLDRLEGQGVDTVVHINPVDADLVQRYAALGARRVVLVSGDADALPALRRLLPGRPWLELVEAVVAPQAGAAQWLRYNVPGLSGLLEAAALGDFYPRLRLRERLPVQAQSLQTVFDGLRLATGDRPNLLVLEAPGLDDALLRSLAPATLQAFGWLLLRGTRPGLWRDGAQAQAAPRWLQERAWRQVHASDDQEPLWPVTLLQFDAAKAALSAQLEQLRAQLEAQAQAKSALDKTAAERAAQIEQLGKARDEYAKQAGERQKHIVQLEAELADLAARYALLQEELVKSEAHVELIADLVLRESLR